MPFVLAPLTPDLRSGLSQNVALAQTPLRSCDEVFAHDRIMSVFLRGPGGYTHIWVEDFFPRPACDVPYRFANCARVQCMVQAQPLCNLCGDGTRVVVTERASGACLRY